MASVKTLIEENSISSRKTKNNDLYYKLLCAICSDNDYIAKNTKAVTSAGGILTDDLHLSTEFQRIFAAVLKKHTSMSEAEAFEAAKDVELSTDQARTLMNIVHEADYLMMKECKKKIQFINKPGFDVTLAIEPAAESVRPNPQDRSKSVKIEAHDRLRVTQKIFDFQKKVIKTPKK